jgi:hypothetical protein
MAGFGIEDAAFAGVGLLGRKPFAAVVWALAYAVFLAVVLVPFAGPLAAFFTTFAKSGGHPTADELLPLTGGLLGLFVLLALGSLVVGSVISCAVFRAILQPEESSFAYMRLGSEELWVMLVGLVRNLLTGIVQIVLAIPVGILVGLLTTSVPGIAAPVRAAGQFLIYLTVIWMTLRLSLAGPITFAERRFRLFESWTLTRGYGWRLLAVALIVGIIGAVVYLIALLVGLIGGFAIWKTIPHPADMQSFLTQPASSWMGSLAPLLSLIGGLVWLVAAILTPIVIAPWARIYHTLASGSDTAVAVS